MKRGWRGRVAGSCLLLQQCRVRACPAWPGQRGQHRPARSTGSPAVGTGQQSGSTFTYLACSSESSKAALATPTSETVRLSCAAIQALSTQHVVGSLWPGPDLADGLAGAGRCPHILGNARLPFGAASVHKLRKDVGCTAVTATGVPVAAALLRPKSGTCRAVLGGIRLCQMAACSSEDACCCCCCCNKALRRAVQLLSLGCELARIDVPWTQL